MHGREFRRTIRIGLMRRPNARVQHRSVAGQKQQDGRRNARNAAADNGDISIGIWLHDAYGPANRRFSVSLISPGLPFPAIAFIV